MDKWLIPLIRSTGIVIVLGGLGLPLWQILLVGSGLTVILATLKET